MSIKFIFMVQLGQLMKILVLWSGLEIMKDHSDLFTVLLLVLPLLVCFCCFCLWELWFDELRIKRPSTCVYLIITILLLLKKCHCRCNCTIIQTGFWSRIFVLQFRIALRVKFFWRTTMALISQRRMCSLFSVLKRRNSSSWGSEKDSIRHAMPTKDGLIGHNIAAGLLLGGVLWYH